MKGRRQMIRWEAVVSGKGSLEDGRGKKKRWKDAKSRLAYIFQFANPPQTKEWLNKKAIFSRPLVPV